MKDPNISAKWEKKPPKVQWSNHQNLSMILTDIQCELIFRSKDFNYFLLSSRKLNKQDLNNITRLVAIIKEIYYSIEDYLFKNAREDFYPYFIELQKMTMNLNSNPDKPIPKGFLELVDFCSSKIRGLCIKANVWFQTDNDSFDQHKKEISI